MYRIQKRLETPDGRSFLLLIGEEDGVRYWGKALPTERSLSELEELFTLLQTVDYPALPAPVAWGSGLVVDSESKSFIIYPWIDGVKLDAAWSTADSLQQEHWMIEILRALDILHFRGVVHGDLKPENILIDANGSAKLIDLDWSFRSHETLERKSGTLRWMAPEVLDGTPPDGRSDLYSMGLVLYALSSGLPNETLPAQERLAKDLQFTRLDPNDPWRAWLERCCRHDPRRRWESAFEAYRALPLRDSPLPFYDAKLTQARLRPRPTEGRSALDSILVMIGVRPTPNGFFDSTLARLSEGEILKRWERAVAQPELRQALNEGRPITESLLARCDRAASGEGVSEESEEEELAEVLRPIMDLYRIGRYRAAIEAGERLSNKEAIGLGERARLLNLIGLCLSAEGDLPTAIEKLLEAQRDYRRIGDLHGETKTANNLGMIAQQAGEEEEANRRYLEALTLARRAEDRRLIGSAVGNLAALCQARNQTEKALSYFEEAQSIFEELGLGERRARCAYNRAALLSLCGRFDPALAAVEEALAKLEEAEEPHALLLFLKIEILLDAERVESLRKDSNLLSSIRSDRFDRLPPPHGPRAIALRLRLADAGLLEDENFEKPIGDRADAETDLWRAMLLLHQGDAESSVQRLERIDPQSAQPETLVKLRIALFRERLGANAPGYPGIGKLKSEIEALLEEWSQRVPIAFQRDWWAHPLYEQTQRTLRRLERAGGGSIAREVSEVATIESLSSLLEAPDLDTLLQTALETLVRTARAERGFLILARDGEEKVAAAVHFKKEAIEHPQFEISRTLLRKAIDSGETVQSADAREETGLGRSVYDLNVVSILILPFIRKGEVLGAAYLDHRRQQGVFDDASIDLLRVLAGQIAVAIHSQDLKLRLAEKTEELERTVGTLSEAVRRQDREKNRLSQNLIRAKRTLEESYSANRLVGDSPAIRRIRDQTRRAADAPLPVLISGESGSGKELVARALHFESERSEAPFVAVNCGSFPDTLVEAELFGYRKGAFTGADRDRDGAFLQANGGSLLLDEINAMGPLQQVKLLRALQEGEVRPLGADKPIRIDVRILSAANLDLKKLCEDGSFREDLYYRLAGMEIHLPPLRERIEDLPLLIERIRREWRERTGEEASFTNIQLQRWMRYDWPGNVRELQNMAQRFFVFGEDPLEDRVNENHWTAGDSHEEWLRKYMPLDGRERGYQEAVMAFERDLIRMALKEAGGVKAEAARMLGLRRQYFRNYSKKLELE